MEERTTRNPVMTAMLCTRCCHRAPRLSTSVSRSSPNVARAGRGAPSRRTIVIGRLGATLELAAARRLATREGPRDELVPPMRPRVRRARGELRAARRLERVAPPGRHGVGARGDRGREAFPKTSARERVGGAFPGEDVRAAARRELGARLL